MASHTRRGLPQPANASLPNVNEQGGFCGGKQPPKMRRQTEKNFAQDIDALVNF